MARTTHYDHVFRYRNRTVRLIYHIEIINRRRQLVLDDVVATTSAIANGVSDHRIEAEACKAAYDRRAVYI